MQELVALSWLPSFLSPSEPDTQQLFPGVGGSFPSWLGPAELPALPSPPALCDPKPSCSRQGRVCRKGFCLPSSEPWARGRGAPPFPAGLQCSLQPACHGPGWQPQGSAGHGQNPSEGWWSCSGGAQSLQEQGHHPAQCQLTPPGRLLQPLPSCLPLFPAQNLSSCGCSQH